ncbi:hypothetical protein ACODT5_28815 [Streptomyces sp. 5.8]|uniref:hypothetical protein n=1 Tax=Streptomyces sp. 5.8 TaxID=3406571 RepID=UPI003BB606BE
MNAAATANTIRVSHNAKKKRTVIHTACACRITTGLRLTTDSVEAATTEAGIAANGLGWSHCKNSKPLAAKAKPRPTSFTVDICNMRNTGSPASRAARRIAETLGAATDVEHLRNASGRGIYTHRVHFMADADTTAALQIMIPTFLGKANEAALDAAHELRADLVGKGVKGALLERHCAHLERATILTMGADLVDAL